MARKLFEVKFSYCLTERPIHLKGGAVAFRAEIADRCGYAI
jgi:hypothetical protein